MEDFTRAEQKCRCINNMSGCWLLECLMCNTTFCLFYFNVCWLCIHLEVWIWYCQAKGYLGNIEHWGESTDVQHHSGLSLKTQEFEHQHGFHCCASTGGSPLRAAIFKSACYFSLRQQFRLSKSLLSFVSARVLACSFWSDHRKYFNTSVLTQRWFINSLAPLGIPTMFKILTKWSLHKIATSRVKSDRD